MRIVKQSAALLHAIPGGLSPDAGELAYASDLDDGNWTIG
jgi:hypothetical protein